MTVLFRYIIFQNKKYKCKNIKKYKKYNEKNAGNQGETVSSVGTGKENFTYC